MEYTKGELPCGCKADTTFNPENYTIIFCPLHKSAPDLYEALKELLPLTVGCWRHGRPEFDRTRKALAKAEGKDG